MPISAIKTRSEIVESNQGYVSVWKRLAGDRHHADLSDLPGLSTCWADSQFLFWNALFLNEEISEADTLQKRIVDAAALMRTKQHEGLLYICEDYLSDDAKEALPRLLAEEKMDFVLPIIGMVGDFLPSLEEKPCSLKFKRATDEKTLQDYADINSSGYGFSMECGREGLSGSALWKETALAYVGYVDNQAVSAAAVIPNDGMLYLALVATRPDFQRQGFAEATVRHALCMGYQETGLTRTLLHATEAGAPVYERVGYHKTTLFLTYKPSI